MAHVDEALRAALADQRRVLHEVQVVGQHHQLAGAHGGVQAAGRVGLHQHLDTAGGQCGDRALHGRRVAVFVGVSPPGQHGDLVRTDAADHHLARMSVDARLRETGQVRIRQAQRVLHTLGQRRPTRAQQHGDLRPPPAGEQQRCAAVDDLVTLFAHDSPR